jgi:hypothetical protein
VSHFLQKLWQIGSEGSSAFATRADWRLLLPTSALQMRNDEADAVIKKTAGENEVCRRLVAIPGKPEQSF